MIFVAAFSMCEVASTALFARAVRKEAAHPGLTALLPEPDVAQAGNSPVSMSSSIGGPQASGSFPNCGPVNPGSASHK